LETLAGIHALPLVENLLTSANRKQSAAKLRVEKKKIVRSIYRRFLSDL
jgi:hypothetical protein